MTIEPFALDDVPLYNADLDADGRRPVAVERLKKAVADAGALLIATPEYNHTVPGVLQNAIDWASRPGLKSPLAGKPVAIMGTSVGVAGTARAAASQARPDVHARAGDAAPGSPRRSGAGEIRRLGRAQP